MRSTFLTFGIAAPASRSPATAAVQHGLCACGSGLRSIRCCQLDLSMLPTSDAVQRLASVVGRALELDRHNQIAEAEKLCCEILELAPNHLDLLSLLYRIRRDAGDQRAAEALLRRIVTLHPNTFWATNELTLALLQKGDIAEAEIHARSAVRIAPENPQSHNLMGMIMTASSRPHVGEYHYRKVIALSGGRGPALLANLAENLKNQGRMSESRSTYEEAANAGPEVLPTLLGWARMEEADRNFDRAAELLDQAEKLAPRNPSVLLWRAVLCGRTGCYDAALDLLDAIAAQSQDIALGPNELLQKGRLLDRMGHYGEAFAAFVEGKQKCREISGLAYLDNRAQELIERLRGFFTATRMRIMPRAHLREDPPRPIFILGFPRSGTTLVEQMLSAHSQISAGDELPFINEIAGATPRMLNSPLSYPEALAELWMGDRRNDLDALRDYYMHRVLNLGILDPDVLWFTDKMPLNETHLGLIALMFPRAPLIHVLRHPLDVVLSVFSNHLTHGFYCAYDLGTAARHYVRVMELLEHYRSVLPLNYLPVRYESIVDEQETTLRRMLDFIGAPFETSCLQFHENRRYARTASYAQVTEPLYNSSRYRYRQYLKEMDPVIPVLEPTIRRLGYTID